MPNSPFRLCLFGAAMLPFCAAAEPVAVPRSTPAEGAVISRVSGESVRFVDEVETRDLALGQDLLGGDLVRTGPNGLLGLRFADRTVMRLHPNSELVVRSASASSAELGLNAGALWGRAQRGSAAVTVTTPTAAAAIRGTDWALEIEADGGTRLSVFDGAVRLSNEFGAVEAGAGQQALAAPGRAPAIVQVANRREASQMLFSAPFAAAVDPLSAAADAQGPATGPGAAGYAEGLAALRAGRFEAAADRLAASAAGLDPAHAAAARWLAAFAAAEAGRGLAPPPAPPGAERLAAEAIGRAYYLAGLGDLDGAARAVASSEEPAALAAAVEIAILRGEPEEAARIVARLKAEAPGSVAALGAEASLAADGLGDYARAVRLYEEALALDPENADLWNDLGLARDALDHPRETEAALRRAVALAPFDPTPVGNLLIHLLDENRAGEARILLDETLARFPGDYLALRAAARLAIQEGRDEEAVSLGLDAVAAQPAAAETSIMLALAAYQAGDRTRAEQELDAARRLDPNDPIVPFIRASIAVDEARADDAIRFAREAARLYRLGASGLDRLASDRAGGSALVQAFDSLSLAGWARDVADRTFDPLAADSLASEGIVLRPFLGEEGPQASPLGSNALIQALLVDPLAASARIRYSDFLRRPFVDGEISGSAGFGDREGGEGEATVQGFAFAPFPVAWTASASGGVFDDDITGNRDESASLSALVGFQPAAHFGGFVLVSLDREESDGSDGSALQFSFADRRSDSAAASAGVSLRLPERAIFSLYGSASWLDADQDVRRPLFPPFPRPRLETLGDVEAESQFLAASWRATDEGGYSMAGLEGSRLRTRQTTELLLDDFLSGGVIRTRDRADETALSGRAYVQRRQRLAPGVEGEAGAALLAFDEEGADADLRVALRGGLGWRIDDRHWIRAAGFLNADQPGQSLAPFTVLGLAPLGAPLEPGGSLDGVVARWDGEISERVHLSVEHQSFRLEELSFETGDPLVDFPVERGRIHRTEARADIWLGGGFGAFASVAWTESEIERGAGRGLDLPGAPRWSGSAGLAYVHPSQVRASAEAVWLGERFGDLSGAELDPVVTANASLSWEPFDRRARLAIEARNLFDAEADRAFARGTTGRSVFLSAAIRF